MKKFEFDSWVEFVKGAFPTFNPSRSQLLFSAWQDVLKPYSLEQSQEAVKIYLIERSSKYEPQPKDILEILKANKPIEMPESSEKAEKDYPSKRFGEDIALGCCRHNLYIYQEVYTTYNRIDSELLEEVCLKRTGKVAEFPSDDELAEKGINPKEKMPVEDIYRLLEIFKQKGCRL